MTSHIELKSEIEKIISDKYLTTPQILKSITSLLQQYAEKYTWVGFYHMNDTNQTLHLGQYTGKETDHTVIPYGKGICGQVAVTGSTYIAEDVTAESNYIACSIDVRSEIVVPIYHNKKLVAQLDIDSKQANAFDDADRKMLEELCNLVGETFGADLRIQRLED